MTEHYKGRVAWETINHFELNFNLGNVVKYVCRAEQKGGVSDLAKARDYLNDEIRKWEQREKRRSKRAMAKDLNEWFEQQSKQGRESIPSVAEENRRYEQAEGDYKVGDYVECYHQEMKVTDVEENYIRVEDDTGFWLLVPHSVGLPKISKGVR